MTSQVNMAANASVPGGAPPLRPAGDENEELTQQQVAALGDQIMALETYLANVKKQVAQPKAQAKELKARVLRSMVRMDAKKMLGPKCTFQKKQRVATYSFGVAEIRRVFQDFTNFDDERTDEFMDLVKGTRTTKVVRTLIVTPRGGEEVAQKPP